MGERKGTKGLELWCRRMTEGYPGVNVVNMTTSWRDGLAFCAIIHHFRPDLIEYSKLNKDDVYYNNELAFRTAERHLGIPALLEPEDMVEFAVPDRLSILTYLSQFYQTFVVSQGKSSSRIAPKRPATSPDHGILSPASSSPPTKIATPSVGKIRREPCAKCALPVFIAERLNVGKLLYHRTCFRCARCNSQLTLANYYETENNQFCCETCPDEEKKSKEEAAVLSRSLSDEEKSASLKKNEETDDYSANFESLLENPIDGTLQRNATLSSSARSFFMNAQVGAESSESEIDEPPDLPSSKPPTRSENFVLKDFNVSDTRVGETVNSGSCSEPDKSHDVVTKDAISAEGDAISLVKARMRLFEHVETGKSDATNEVRKSTQVPKRNSNFSSLDRGFNDRSLDDFGQTKRDSIVTILDSSQERSADNSVITVEDSSSILETSDDSVKNELTSPHVDAIPILVIEDSPEFTISGETKPKSEVSVKSPEQVESVQEITRKQEFAAEDLSSKSDDDIRNLLNKKVDLVEKLFSKVEEKSPNDSDLLIKDSQFDVKGEPPPTFPENKPFTNIDSTEKEDLPTTEEKVLIENKCVEEKERLSQVADALSAEIIVEDSTPVPDNFSKEEIVVTEVHQVFENEEATIRPSSPGVKNENIDNVVVVNVEEEYPDDLNPFGDEGETEAPKTALNPFGDDSEEEKIFTPKPAARKKIRPNTDDKNDSKLCVERISVNPFEEDDEVEVPQPSSRRKVIEAPRISLNPFWSDDEDKEGDADHKPVPKPRISKTGAPEPKPRESGLSINSSTTFGSSTSLSSCQSGPEKRKKKPAPKPPSMGESGASSLTSSPSPSVTHSPKGTLRIKKSKKAPLPPTSSTPIRPSTIIRTDEFEQEKLAKDELNRNRQSQNLQSPTSSENSSSLGGADKSTYGKWKRRKGQAPSRPIPQRRTIKSLPLVEVRRELEVIEIQQQGLEKQGVRLEQIIRDKCEGDGVNHEEPLSPEVDDLILQLFELVNEKNELFRKQAELMYLRRQHRLEEEHADVEYQIRCLMLQPEPNKTDSDKAREEELIKRLVEIVERRNEIIECLEMDRVREAEEDDCINNQLNLYTLKKDDKASGKQSKKDKKKHKEKKSKLKGGHKVDADKDIDESESPTSSAKVKEKKKKKFNIF